jgi:Family of unknown function (DUF5771)
MAPMKSKCPKGKIYVRGYKTKGSRKRASHRVKGHCTKDTGLIGRTPRSKRILPKLKKGEFGTYHANKPHPKRMAILKRLVSRLSYSTVLKRLVVLRTYTRRSDPAHSKKYSKDISALQKWHKSHMKAGKKASSRKPRVTRKKRTLKRKSVKKVTKRKSAKKSVKKVTKRKSAKKSVKKVTKRKTVTRRRRVVRHRSTVMNK